MRIIGIAAALSAGLIGVGVAYSSQSPEVRGSKDAVWGGGRFEFPGPIVRDFSVFAEGGPFSGARGQVTTGVNGALTIQRTEVTCVGASGNKAVVGGIIREFVNPDFVGSYLLFYVIDNGLPGSATLDQTSGGLILDATDVAQMPRGFPKVCPSPETVLGGFQYNDITAGDIVVRDAGKGKD
jgi:hypothetical protein